MNCVFALLCLKMYFSFDTYDFISKMLWHKCADYKFIKKKLSERDEWRKLEV